MARKLIVNNTPYLVKGTIGVRRGVDQPGHVINTVDFTIPANGQQYIEYGDNNNPFVDSLMLSGSANGAIIISDQVVIQKSGGMDDRFNRNDTFYVALQGESFVLTSSNTWTV